MPEAGDHPERAPDQRPTGEIEARVGGRQEIVGERLPIGHHFHRLHPNPAQQIARAEVPESAAVARRMASADFEHLTTGQGHARHDMTMGGAPADFGDGHRNHLVVVDAVHEVTRTKVRDLASSARSGDRSARVGAHAIRAPARASSLDRVEANRTAYDGSLYHAAQLAHAAPGRTAANRVWRSELSRARYARALAVLADRGAAGTCLAALATVIGIVVKVAASAIAAIESHRLAGGVARRRPRAATPSRGTARRLAGGAAGGRFSTAGPPARTRVLRVLGTAADPRR